MNIMLSAFCAVSANMDTVVVCIAYGLKRIRLSLAAILTLSFISSAGTFLSMYLGQFLIKRINSPAIKSLGAVTLLILGFYYMFEGIRGLKGYHMHPEMLEHPEMADTDHSGRIDFRESVALALALTINNIGVGIAAGVSGLDLLPTTLFTFVFTPLSIKLGFTVGLKYAHVFGRYAGIVSGVIVMFIGVLSIVG